MSFQVSSSNSVQLLVNHIIYVFLIFLFVAAGSWARFIFNFRLLLEQVMILPHSIPVTHLFFGMVRFHIPLSIRATAAYHHDLCRPWLMLKMWIFTEGIHGYSCPTLLSEILLTMKRGQGRWVRYLDWCLYLARHFLEARLRAERCWQHRVHADIARNLIRSWIQTKGIKLIVESRSRDHWVKIVEGGLVIFANLITIVCHLLWLIRDPFLMPGCRAQEVVIANIWLYIILSPSSLPFPSFLVFAQQHIEVLACDFLSDFWLLSESSVLRVIRPNDSIYWRKRGCLLGNSLGLN